MKRLIKIVLITAGIVTLLYLSAPFLVGTMFWFASRSQYNSTEPSQVTTFPIPNSDLTVTLYTKSQPRAISYEGEYRILEISGKSESNLYFELLPTSAGDNPHLKAYWHAPDRCLTLVYSGMQGLPYKSLIDLKKRSIVHFQYRSGSGLLASGPSYALSALQFPSFNDMRSLQLSASTLTLPAVEGVFIGTLEEPMEEESSQQSD